MFFSTLHTNDVPPAITRLLGLGVPNYLINATLLGVLAQRLVRTLCPACKEADDTFNETLFKEMTSPWKVTNTLHPHRAASCLECRNTGFHGRTGLYEMLILNEKFRQQLSHAPDLSPLRHAAVASGLQPLRLGGGLKVQKGLTALEPVQSLVNSIISPLARLRERGLFFADDAECKTLNRFLDEVIAVTPTIEKGRAAN